MKVFIDTNIFLDILCRREQFVVPLGADVVDRAISLKANDFEDALF